MKSYLFICLLFIRVTHSYCQSNTDYHFGVKTCLNLANFVEPKTKENLLPTYSIGIALEQRFNPKLSAFYELLYSKQGSNIPIYNDPMFNKLAIRYDYLTLPFGVRYQSKRFPFLIEGGVQIGYLLKHHQEFLPLNGNTTSQTTNLRNTDVGLVAGIGYRLNSHLLIESRYNRSIKTVFKGYSGYDPITKSYVNLSPAERYNQVFSASIVYYL
jgi:hypothetical protein